MAGPDVQPREREKLPLGTLAKVVETAQTVIEMHFDGKHIFQIQPGLISPSRLHNLNNLI